jgi:cytochrome c oxidase subunit IV
LNLAVVIYQALILLTKIKRAQWMPRVLFVLGTLSVLVNAFSRSSLERWNAIPALIIAIAFYKELHSQKIN